MHFKDWFSILQYMLGTSIQDVTIYFGKYVVQQWVDLIWPHQKSEDGTLIFIIHTTFKKVCFYKTYLIQI